MLRVLLFIFLATHNVYYFSSGLALARAPTKDSYDYDPNSDVPLVNNPSNRFQYGSSLGTPATNKKLHWRKPPIEKKQADATVFFEPDNFIEPVNPTEDLVRRPTRRSHLADKQFEEYRLMELQKNGNLSMEEIDANFKKYRRKSVEFFVKVGGAGLVNLLQSGLGSEFNAISTGFFNVNPAIVAGLELFIQPNNGFFINLWGNYQLIMPYAYATFINPMAPATHGNSKLPFVSGNMVDAALVFGFNNYNIKIGGSGTKHYFSGLIGIDFGYRNMLPFYNTYFNAGPPPGPTVPIDPKIVYNSISGFLNAMVFGAIGGVRFNFIENENNKTIFDLLVSIGPGFFNAGNYTERPVYVMEEITGFYSGLTIRLEHHISFGENNNFMFILGLRNKLSFMFIYNQAASLSNQSATVSQISSGFIYNISNLTEVYVGFGIGV